MHIFVKRKKLFWLFGKIIDLRRFLNRLIQMHRNCASKNSILLKKCASEIIVTTAKLNGIKIRLR